MHCSYIGCYVLYLGTALAVLNYGEVPRYVIAPAAEQLQKQQQQHLQSQQQLHFTSQQSLPVNNNNFPASPVHSTSPATSPHFLTGYHYMAPAVTTTIRSPTTTIAPTVTTEALNPGFVYSAPMSTGYDQHAYYAPYNQPNYQTATLTAHSEGDVEQPTLSFTPNYYVPQTAATNSEENSNFYTSHEVAYKAKVSQEPRSMQPEQQERTEEPTTQEQTLTPYQRIFREFADYLLWKRAQAKRQQQIENSQDEPKLGNSPTNGGLTVAQNQYDYTATSGDAVQTSSRPNEMPEPNPTKNLAQTTEKPTRNEQTFQRPIIVAGVGYETSENHVAYLSKPSVTWELPSYNAIQAESADGQLPAIFGEQVTKRPLNDGANRAQCDGSSHRVHQEGDIAPGYMGGGQKFQTFDRREQAQLLEEQNLQKQKQQSLQQQHQQQQQRLQQKQQEVEQQERIQQQQRLQQEQQYQLQQKQQQHPTIQQEPQQSLQNLQEIQQQQQKAQLSLQKLQQKLQEVQQQQQFVQQKQQQQQPQQPLQNLQQKLQEVQQQQSVQQREQQKPHLSLQKLQQKLQEVEQQRLQQEQQYQLQQKQQQHPTLQQQPQLSLQKLQQKLQEVEQQRLQQEQQYQLQQKQQQHPTSQQQPQLSLQKLQQKLQEVQQQEFLQQKQQQPELSLQKLQEAQQQQSVQQQEQQQYQVQQQQYQLPQNYAPQQQQQREYELQQHQQQQYTQAELQQRLQQTHAYASPAPTQQQTIRLGDESQAQKKLHWPLNAVQQLPQQQQQQQPQQGRPLTQSIHNFENEVSQEVKAQTQPIQHVGGFFEHSLSGNDFTQQLAQQQQQPVRYPHTLEATTPTAFLQGSQLTRTSTQPDQTNLAHTNSHVYFSSDVTRLRRPHITYGVPL